ncbi:MAG: sigma-54 dependent transcriptional regulator [Pseudomonadota bacterium]|nr:sigma-54 dependent transcriptional regulator [Pseudomonadota bacterium]MEC8316082.1 sigma-54 dependent transcriptional regulator [Pseudomonadota bacterium]MEC8447500.1 sigma-54 dependent transcriptional regulator [Pseudomonadota bacterium]
MIENKNILIIDDEIDICKLISGVLEDEGYQTYNAQNSDSAISILSEDNIDLIILDVWLEGSKLDGIELLQEIHSTRPEIPIIIISGHGNIDTAVTAIKIGAYDYLEKPFKTERLMHTIKRASETYNLRQEITNIRNKSNYAIDYIGDSNTVIQLNQAIERLSDVKSRILITGGSGVGKELVARLIHNKSSRSKYLFTRLNARNINAAEFEDRICIAESNNDKSFIKELNGGTLFINEISELSTEAQQVLLNLINNKYKTESLDFRLIASTSKDLKSYVSLGLFLDDLFNRISIEEIHIPSLIDRKEDIPPLVRYFIDDYASTTEILHNLSITEDALAILQSYSWPGNIKELRNCIERVILQLNSENDYSIKASHIPIEIRDNNPNISNNNEVLISYNMKDARDLFERNYIVTQLARFNGNISKTAEFIGMERTALHRKLKYLGIDKRT